MPPNFYIQDMDFNGNDIIVAYMSNNPTFESGFGILTNNNLEKIHTVNKNTYAGVEMICYNGFILSGRGSASGSTIYEPISINNQNPTANAGADQTVNENTTVTLDGTASTDPDNDNLTYKWTAPNGITLSDETAAQRTFTTPEVTTNTEYEFQLVVNDGELDSDADVVKITVKNVNSTGVKDIDNMAFSVYPNPIEDKLSIKTDYKIEKISIYSLSGKLILESNKKEISIPKQKAGMYLLKIETKNAIFTKKIILK